MSKPIFEFDRPGGPSAGNTGKTLFVLAVIVALVIFGWMSYTMFRLEVGTGEMAIMTKKVGLDLPNGEEIAPGPEYKGVQRKPELEQRSFFNPYVWEWEVMPQIQVPEGKLAVLISLTGEDLGYGDFLAKMDENGEALTKGIVPGYLNSARYPINPYLYDVEFHDPVIVPAGYKGVVTNLAGPLPKDSTTLLVAPGERGVQSETLKEGTHMLNPYEVQVNLIDCRSHRFNIGEGGEMGFPSEDGFWVSLDGIIEFRVNPEKAAEVYVLYNEEENGDAIDEELVQKVIMPNARSFCRLQGSNSSGVEFIQGETRSQFQDKFQIAMQEACEPLGIEIIQALITKIRPPEQIAKPVRDREIAKQEELQYKQQILQQESEMNLAIEKELVNQKQALVKADQEVVKLTTEAMREQEVAVTKANEQLSVAEYKLDAAKDEASAIVARGKAKADVIEFGNEAEAAGWRKAVEAFDGDGNAYAQYTLYNKLASAYRRVMINTADSPIMQVFESFAKPGSAAPSGDSEAAPADAAVTADSASSPAN